ncbi:MAG: tetratricopeptide repeat protein [Bacteroidota bacterium]|nr:tetratricopeptide repeat protein [Bacteroidota bacterium]MDP4225845.1 tetratricopeptide repeat protein [Bacteroidota bacterium]MDP4275495.1 tetratricopeptide repeat protein [Bacteroidota bacterium]
MLELTMKGKFKIVFLILTFSLFWGSIQAQNYRKAVREGNMSYKNGKYANSEVSYRKALAKSKKPYEAAFNLGDALYKQKKYDEAAQVFNDLSHVKTSNKNLAKVYHNEGNALLQLKKYEESLKAYKESLKINPKDNQTRYNLAYVQAKLKQQNNNNKNKNKNNKNDQNKNKNNQQNKPKPNQGNNKQPNQPPPQPKISKDDAQRMLESLQNDEKNTQQRLKEQAAKAGKSSTLKNW